MNRTATAANRGSAPFTLTRLALLAAACLLAFGPARALAQRAMGIDVYSGHGFITWSSVKGAGYTWAWAKATEGVGYTDSQFANNMNNARAAGVLIAPYHYARYDLGNTGAAEANWFWSVIRPYLKADGSNILPMLDVEQDTSLTQAQVSAWVVDFCQTLIADAAAAGFTVKMVIYTYPSYADTYLNTSVTHTYLLDMASLNGQDPQTGAPYLSTWPTWSSWQYSWSIKVPGVPGDANGYCLMDVYNGSLTQLKSVFTLGGHFHTDSYAGNDGNGNMQLFLPDAVNVLESDWQSCANCGWVGWSGFGGPALLGAPATVGYNSDQRMQVFVRGANNSMWTFWKTALNGGWSSWSDYGGSIAGNVSVGYLPNGAMQVFVRSAGNTVQTMWQNSPNGTWTAWSDMGGSCYGDPTCGANGDGRMQLFVRSSSGTLQSNFKTTSGSWYGWTDYGGSVVGKPAIANLPDGSMQVFVRSATNTVKTIYQTSPNGSWGSWSDLGGDCQGDPVVGYNADGRLQLFIPTSSGAISANFKTATASNAPWYGWYSMGGSYTSALSVGYNQDGRMQLFMRDASYNVQSCWQTNVNGSWNTWQNYGGNTPAVSITTQPSSQTVNVGQNATFTVVANNALSYQWKFNGANISGATASSYTVNNAQTSNAGTYTVVVGNNAGSLTSANAILTVIVVTPPSITTQPSNQTVNQGQNATFSVVATGTAPLSYQWRFNGANLSGATASSYTVSNAQASNAGSYSVVVTNVAGSATSANATLMVNLPPVISQQPASQLAAVSNSVTFSVSLSQGTSPAYQWRYNGSPLAGATQSSLTRSGLAWSSAGSYSVVVTNVAGSVTSANAILTMEQAAFSWTDGFEGYTVGVLDKNQSGGPNTGAANPWWGPAPPNISVFTNTGGVTPHSGSKMIGASAGYQFCQEYLNLPYRLDAGHTYYGNLMLDWWFYDPKGTGAGRTNYGDYFALAQYAPVSLTNDFTTTTFTAWNQRMSLGAYVGTGQNLGVYQARVVGATGGFNANGWFNTATARSVGWHHARIVLGIPTGNSAPVQMFIDNMLTPTFSYANSGTNVGFNLIEINSSFGGINTGGYFDDLSFRAANDPWIAQQPANQSVNAGQSATFTTVAVGTAYQWQFNGANISGATKTSYTITNVQSGNAGTYDCVITGANGTLATTNVTLTVH